MAVDMGGPTGYRTKRPPLVQGRVAMLRARRCRDRRDRSAGARCGGAGIGRLQGLLSAAGNDDLLGLTMNCARSLQILGNGSAQFHQTARMAVTEVLRSERAGNAKLTVLRDSVSQR